MTQEQFTELVRLLTAKSFTLEGDHGKAGDVVVDLALVIELVEVVVDGEFC